MKLSGRLAAATVFALVLITALIAPSASGGSSRATRATTPEATNTESVDVGMPFTGKWAYNVLVNPPYTDNNSSHPSVHATPGGGNWATDLYAGSGTTVRLRLRNPTGALSYSWWATSTSCGGSTGINVKVDGVNVGRIYIAHLANAVRSGSITNGMVLGSVANFGSCNPGPHVHFEVTNTANYACYSNLGRPGTSVSDSTKIGRIGSNNTGPRQACAATPPIQVAVPRDDGDADVTGDGRADAIVVNDDGITVRRSNGTAFGANERWTGGTYVGTHGNYFSDVTGDGLADAIVVTDTQVVVRRSNGSEFRANEAWTGGAYIGTRGNYF